MFFAIHKITVRDAVRRIKKSSHSWSSNTAKIHAKIAANLYLDLLDEPIFKVFFFKITKFVKNHYANKDKSIFKGHKSTWHKNNIFSLQFKSFSSESLPEQIPKSR